MTRIALLSSEPVRERMAGIGIRYLELARRLPRPGIEVVLLSPAEAGETPEIPGEVRTFRREAIPDLTRDCDGAVAQGQLANDLLLARPRLPTAIDLYDPWMIENFSYHRTLGLDPYRNDHATWVLQMSRGDFFLCSSEEQRLFYLGFLTALGRVNPERSADDPDLRGLIAPVPFGVPEDLPPHDPILDPDPDRLTILFGGLYDWYDPWTLLEALERFSDRSWTLLFVENPNPEETPQRLRQEVESWCRKRGWWEERVRFVPWVPSERRFDLLRDVDLLVSPHQPSLETRLSMRTRYLDALAVGCPVILTADGALSRMVREHGAGWVVPAGDEASLARALAEAWTETVDGRREREAGARTLVEDLRWERVLEPLAAFCREPRRDPTRERFAFHPDTVAPEDSLWFRIRRRVRRWLGTSP